MALPEKLKPTDPLSRLIAGSQCRAHLLGIAGSGMRALAKVLHGWGWELTGSDTNAASIASLDLAGVPISAGHAAENVPASADLVIHSDAVPADNVELRRAAELGIPTATYFQVAGHLMRHSQGIAVAGTHGKSTTTAMVARILADAGLEPTVLCGATELVGPNSPLKNNSHGDFVSRAACSRGNCRGFQPHRRVKTRPTGGRNCRLMLVEACEYRRNFLHLRPRLAAILGIEADHFDCYDTLDELENAFRLFAASLPTDGVLLARHDCQITQRVASQVACGVETFGFGSEVYRSDQRQGWGGNPDWMARLIASRQGRCQFEIIYRGDRFCEISLKMPGRHNALNALAAAGLAFHQGVDSQRIATSLCEFPGLERRLESLGTWRGVTILDDYAHHPTEVSATLRTIRQMYPQRRVCCVFQPHQASRTARLLDELAQSLENVDCLAVADIFRAREGPPLPGEVTAADLAAAVRHRGTCASNSHSTNDIHKELINNLQPADVLVTIGAGDIRRIADGYIHWIRENRAAG